jgi:hypothetical protein
MSQAFFHLDPNGLMTALRASAPMSDDELQTLITDHPDLLGGESEGLGRWFVLRRSGPSGVPGVDQWSSRHLFLNRDGVPTIVETRRAADVAANGDLFGRAVLYAANAPVWWPLDFLKNTFASTYARPNMNASEVLSSWVGDAPAPGALWAGSDAFWRRVIDNLTAGRLRMVLVVEQVEPELARLAEFLRDQLREAEVWIIEFRQHEGASGRLFQTRLVGRRRPVKPVRAPRDMPAPRPRPSPAVGAVDAWVSALRERCETDEAAVLDDLLRWMREQYGATFVTGPPTSAYRLSVKESGRDRFPFGVHESKAAAIHLGSLSATVAYGPEEARRALVDELAAAGLADKDVDIGGELRIPLKVLVSPTARTRLLRVLDGVLEHLRLREAPNVFSN